MKVEIKIEKKKRMRTFEENTLWRRPCRSGRKEGRQKGCISNSVGGLKSSSIEKVKSGRRGNYLSKSFVQSFYQLPRHFWVTNNSGQQTITFHQICEVVKGFQFNLADMVSDLTTSFWPQIRVSCLFLRNQRNWDWDHQEKWENY